MIDGKHGAEKDGNNETLASDKTEYLYSNPANRQHLLEAIENAKNPENLVVVSMLSWEETYKAMAVAQEDWSDFDDTLLDGIEDSNELDP
jgi:hypothetical protein